MPSKKKNQRVYDPDYIKSLQGIPLPPKIKCGRCEKYKGQANYSHKQLCDAREAIKFKGKNAQYSIKCSQCAGGQPMELQCSVCDITKGMDDFAKSQRSKGDAAVCFACVDKRTAVEAVDEHAYENPAKAFVPMDTTADGKYPEYWTNTSTTLRSKSEAEEDEWGPADQGGVSLTRKFGNLSMAPSVGTLIDTDDTLSFNSRGGPVKSDDDDGWEQATSKKKGVGKAGSTSYQSFDSRYTENSYSTARDNTIIKKNGWAKIPAYKPQKPPSLHDDDEEDEEDDWESQSSGEENCDGDDSDTEI